MPDSFHAQIQPRPLSGPEKVAALLLTMGRPAANRLLKHFDPIELRQITKSAADLGSVPSATIDTIVDEFSSKFVAGLDLMGTAGEAQQLLSEVLPPDQVADIMSDVLGSSNNLLWDRLSTIAEASFADYIVKEHPQTAALILSKVPTATAAKVISLIPRVARNALVRRMLALKPASDPPMTATTWPRRNSILSPIKICRSPGA